MIGRPRTAVPSWRETGTTLAEATGVTVTRAGRRILDGVDIDIRAGEVLGLVGPNGAGKSTLLSVLAADLPPDTGSVDIDGRAARRWKARELARRRAVLQQHHELSFPFTVEQVVEMGRAPWADGPARIRDLELVTRYLVDCEIDDLADRTFPTLSGGERARVALARVLTQDTQLILLDEPTAALDVRHQELVLRLCRMRADAGAAVVIVLHDLGLAAAHCDRVAVVHEGVIRGIGSPREVFEAELLTRVYRHPVEVLPHPHRDVILVLPRHS